MSIIYLNNHRKLNEEQKKMAEILISNEINSVGADLEIMEEEFSRTSLFGNLDLMSVFREYVSQFKRNKDGGYDEALLKRVYDNYYPE